ncbi:MAG: orotidine-5'-phosphate decarboxylase [Oscillospiraceae bacterium]|nr:orotidine-5'-phosphate decarboxylase [Oscillospiraceae bacterium]
MSIDVLQEKIRKLKNPVMVGLDPYLPMLPPHLVQEAFDALGQTPEGAAAAYGRYCAALLDALAGLVPAVKIQSACFEALGAPGIAKMQALTQYAADRGYYVLLDSMRGDVGNIAEIYAQAMFGSVTVGETSHRIYAIDGLTVNGYLGSDGVKPFLPYCKKEGKSIFLLLKTSNKSSREVQDLLSGDRVVYTAMADLAARWGGDCMGRCGYSNLAAVVGATYPNTLKLLREKYSRLFFLVPGYGTQGGTAKNVQYAFDRFGHGAVVTASRSILCAWQRAGSDGTDFAEQAVAAAKKMKNDISKYVVIL